MSNGSTPGSTWQTIPQAFRTDILSSQHRPLFPDGPPFLASFALFIGYPPVSLVSSDLHVQFSTIFTHRVRNSLFNNLVAQFVGVWMHSIPNMSPTNWPITLFGVPNTA